MAEFPGSIFSRRAVADRAGVVYDADKTKVFYAKDHNDFGKEIVAIENALGVDFPFNWPMKITGALTRDSDDDPSFVLKIADVDWTAKLVLGMRIKWTQNGTVRYGIITKLSFSTHTYVTIYGGTDYNMLNSTTYPITNCFVSMVKAPLGFPLNPDKWTVEVTEANLVTKGAPVASTWYNMYGVGQVFVTIPIGVWNVEYSIDFQIDDSVVGAWYGAVTLSETTAAESDNDLTASIAGYGTVARDLVARKKVFAVTSKSSLYINTMTPSTGLDNLRIVGSASKTIVRVICAYL